MNIQHYLDTHPAIIGLITMAGMFAIFYTSKAEREQLRRGNTKYLRRACEQIKEALDDAKNEDMLESARRMLDNFRNAYQGTIQGDADINALECIYQATKTQLAKDRRYIDNMNAVMWYGQNLYAEEKGRARVIVLN